MQWMVILEKSSDGTIWGLIPDLDGCYTCGLTENETLSNAKEAIQLYLDDLRQSGKLLPLPTHFKAEMIEV